MTGLASVKEGANGPAAERYRYDVRAHADPQTLLRVVGLFSQRGLIPIAVQSARAGESLSISIEVELDAAAVAELLLQKLRTLVLVEDVQLIERSA